MKELKKLTICAAISFSMIGCAANAEVTYHKLCDPSTEKAQLDEVVPLYSEASIESKVLEQVSVRTVVKVIDHRNHNVWSPKDFVKVQTESNTGFMNPKCFVANQDPEKSIWRYSRREVKDYKYFYDPEDKTHYDKSYEYPALAKLPKERIPLKDLLGK
ncbi:Lsa16 family lipoprotein adhesin [Leptospira sp. GIMC2001]|uniref:Lsa16 family lipoprotein adhesin n=1 Tax=Leptospira sp. GIMC2001 TaxID=1513297 RepID=UPI00234B8A25|nr:SH3 domain-containing protein [Leptospira sp. GIMC2001]WCL48453.1 SH3 domain-containing protein [Leptospira sp. GIMC2001]